MRTTAVEILESKKIIIRIVFAFSYLAIIQQIIAIFSNLKAHPDGFLLLFK